MKRVVLVDGNNLGFRAFGRSDLSFGGQRTELVFTGLRIISSHLAEHAPDLMVVAWDSGRDSRRMALFPGYKETGIERTEEEKQERQEFFRQVGILRELLHALGIMQIRGNKREADDVIYTMTRVGGESPIQSIGDYSDFGIISTDKDYFQLLGDSRIWVQNPITGKIYNQVAAEQELGVPLEKYALVKALVGGHDEIPGIPGVGPVRAMFFLQNWEALMAGTLVVPGIKGKLWGELTARLPEVELWESISRFMLVPVEELRENLMEEPPMNQRQWLETVRKMIDQYGFKSLLEGPGQFISGFQQYLTKRFGV